MKLLPILLLIVLVSGTLAQVSRTELSLVVARHEPATQKEAGPDFAGPLEKYTFRIVNKSKFAFYIRGDDVDGPLTPTGVTLFFDNGQWLYPLNPLWFQLPAKSWPSGPKLEQKLNPGKSTTFQKLLTPCERVKLVAYARQSLTEIYQPLFSEETIVAGCRF